MEQLDLKQWKGRGDTRQKKKIDAWKGLPTEHDKIGTEKLSTLQLSYVHLTQCVISDVTPSTEKFIGGAKYVISM